MTRVDEKKEEIKNLREEKKELLLEKWHIDQRLQDIDDQIKMKLDELEIIKEEDMPHYREHKLQNQ